MTYQTLVLLIFLIYGQECFGLTMQRFNLTDIMAGQKNKDNTYELRLCRGVVLFCTSIDIDML